MKPTAFQLFSMYYLGLTPGFRAKFFNLNAIARHFNVEPGQVEQWLKDYKMPPEAFQHVDFNVAQAHGRAQELGLFSSADEAREYARKTFKEALDKLADYSEEDLFEDIDYNDIWGDEK